MKDKKYPWNHSIRRSRSGKDAEGPRPMEAVYAGPSYWGGKDDPEIMNDVYAGPEFFQDPTDPPDVEEPAPTPMQGVYAGPEWMSMNRPEMFMTAYAAPVPTSGGGMYFSPPPTEERKKMCTRCGATIAESAKFCSECGAVQPKEDGHES
ncbi:MAG: zinc ribbon domain-containing protein [Clostridia bacterium]|nr:zinc ribbon domain-containing protein [Clostridia bacterium]